MPGRAQTNQTHKPLLYALGTLAVLLALSVLVWLALVRPQLGKGRSESISDDYSASTILQDGQTASQTFTFDEDLLAIGMEFYLPGGQPAGTLELVLSDADTGEELARSTGVMEYIVSDQYTVLGLDQPVTGTAGRRYRLSLTPHYTGSDLLALGHSSGVALWQDPMAVDGSPVDGTMALQVTYQRIGGYLTRFFLLICGAASHLHGLGRHQPPGRAAPSGLCAGAGAGGALLLCAAPLRRPRRKIPYQPELYPRLPVGQPLLERRLADGPCAHHHQFSPGNRRGPHPAGRKHHGVYLAGIYRHPLHHHRCLF